MRNAKKKFYLNLPENEAAEIISSLGYSFSKRGYPDFTVYNEDGSIYGFVEVKPNEDSRLKTNQATFFDFCVERNIPCIRWCPSDGPNKIKEFIKGK